MGQIFTIVRAFVDCQMSALALHRYLNTFKEGVVIDQQPYRPILSVINPTLDSIQAQRFRDDLFNGQKVSDGMGDSLIFYPFCNEDSQTGYMISLYKTILPKGGSTLRSKPEKMIIIPSMEDVELRPEEILESPADEYLGRPDKNRYPCKYPEVEDFLEQSIARLFFAMNRDLPSTKPSL